MAPFCWDLRGRSKHTFLKKTGKLASGKIIVAYFFLVVSNMENVGEKFIGFIEGSLTSIEQATISSFLWDLRKSISKLFKKKATFPVFKDFGLFFLVLSSVTNLKIQFVRVQKFL